MANGKYDPLNSFLVASEKTTIRLSLAEIAQLVDGLPDEAMTPQFWANTYHHLARRGAWLNAGYRAFFEKDEASVRFEKQAEKGNVGWSDAELEACVNAYRTLWVAEQRNEALNKSKLRREIVNGSLSSRSEGAYERRMQNISAVLDELGIPRVAGYAPLKNVGAPGARLKTIIQNVWSQQRSIAILTSRKTVRSAFQHWHEALLETAEYEGSVGWLPAEEIAFSAYNNAPDGQLENKVALSTDPDGENWVLQINIPNSPSTENGLSAIGEDTFGNLFLLRQGVLHENNISKRINADEFEELSSIPSAEVKLAGAPAKRRWFVVTAISDDYSMMRRNTARFVELCARIRDPDLIDSEQAKADADEIEDRFGKEEAGGQSTFWSIGGSRVARRRHGEVWQALKARLAESGKSLRKPAHARGYETDGEVGGPDDDLLLEIKTSCSAADVYTGVGQLQVYPKMLPRLANHRKILLLPGRPSDELVAALSDLEIELHTYICDDTEDWTNARFPQEFLKACGVEKLIGHS
jgi:hypothetical protein|tara:strand:+ start:6377 stop:7951 length:1575 start_codon:yes stop_codon:yes gene_type:complete